MKRLATLLVPLAVVATCVGCAPRRHATTEAPARAGARTPEDVDRLFGERLNAGDLEGLVALYEPTATLVRQDRTAATGTAAIREELAGAVGLHPQISMNVFRVLSGGDVAVLYDDWQATGTDPHGKRIAISGHAAETVRRQPDGTWKFVVDDPDARSVACKTGAPHHAQKHHPAKHGHHEKHAK